MFWSIPHARRASLVIATLLACAAHAQVFRCEVNGKVTLTDMPCTSSGRMVAPAPRQPAVTSGPAPVVTTTTTTTQQVQIPSRQVPLAGAGAVPGGRPGAPEPGACPSDTDVANIQTRLSARLHPPGNMSSLQMELGKAQRCRSVGGRYGHDDWRRLEAVLRGDH